MQDEIERYHSLTKMVWTFSNGATKVTGISMSAVWFQLRSCCTTMVLVRPGIKLACDLLNHAFFCSSVHLLIWLLNLL